LLPASISPANNGLRKIHSGGWRCHTEYPGGSLWRQAELKRSLCDYQAATGTNTIASGDNGAQIWNWAMTTAGRVAMILEKQRCHEHERPTLEKIRDLAGSTATPLNVTNSLNGFADFASLSITPTLEYDWSGRCRTIDELLRIRPLVQVFAFEWIMQIWRRPSVAKMKAANLTLK